MKNHLYNYLLGFKFALAMIIILVFSNPVHSLLAFSWKIHISGQTLGACSVYSVDLDGDGDNDVLSASFDDDTNNHKIAWYENLNGYDSFGPQRIITEDPFGPHSVISADIDGDGDNDIIAAFGADKIAWYENLNGPDNFSEQRVITTDVDAAYAVNCSDLDGDDDLDILSASLMDDKIAWYENTDGQGTFSDQVIISEIADGARDVLTADVDGDGDLDVFSVSDNDNKVAWYENLDGLGSFGYQRVISNNAGSIRSVSSVDIDSDGDYDVIIPVDDEVDAIIWYENIDGLGDFGHSHIITTEINRPREVYCSDIDGDGDFDVLSASTNDDKVAWYENIDGFGNFGLQQIITLDVNCPVSIFSVDLDGDQDFDVLSASVHDNKIAWYENIDGLGSFGQQKNISPGTDRPSSIFSVDIDGDGDKDVMVSASGNNSIVWYENIDSNGSFYPRQVITTDALNATSIFCIDLDGDGDNDAISTSSGDSKIAWYENTDGSGNFGQQQVISLDATEAISGFSADLDGDGDNDIISASIIGINIAWYENIDGLGDFGPPIPITSEAENIQSVFSIDIDNDGDNDILSASSYAEDVDGKIAWYENIDGMGIFGEQNIISTDVINAKSIYCKDIDGDGDADVISASQDDDKIAWYENLDGSGNFSPQLIIPTNWMIYRPVSVYSVDLDGDGDNDVVSASLGNEEEHGWIFWNENTDGLGDFSSNKSISRYENGANNVRCDDLDGDGDVDILSICEFDNLIAWNRNLGFVEVDDYDLNPIIPLNYKILSVHPNPFNPLTTIEIGLPIVSNIQLIVYNTLGQEVTTLYSGQHPAGYHSFSFDGSNSANGIYFVRAYVPGRMNEVRKVVLLK